MFNGRTLFYVTRKVEVGGRTCDIHLFFDEGRKAGELERFFKKVACVETHFNGAEFENAGKVKMAVDSFAPEMFRYLEISVKAGKSTLSRKVAVYAVPGIFQLNFAGSDPIGDNLVFFILMLTFKMLFRIIARRAGR